MESKTNHYQNTSYHHWHPVNTFQMLSKYTQKGRKFVKLTEPECENVKNLNLNEMQTTKKPTKGKTQ